MTFSTLSSQAQTTTCADCPYYAARNDGTNKGWCKLFDVFAKENHAQTQDCVNTIADAAQQELDEYIEAQSEEIAPKPVALAANEIEIDSDVDLDFGTIYRVWQSFYLLGTFYQDLNGKWVAQPVGSDFRPRLNTPEQAQLVIIASYYGLPSRVAA